MDKFLEFNTEEILTCLLLVVIGYFIAKMFSCCANRVDGFSVGNLYKCNLERSAILNPLCDDDEQIEGIYTCLEDADGTLSQSECDLLTRK